MMKTMTAQDLLNFLSKLPPEKLSFKVKMVDDEHPDGWVSVKYAQAHRVYDPETGETEELILLEGDGTLFEMR